MKTIIKWIAGFGIGLFFIWLSAREWPFEKIFASGIGLEGRFLVSSEWTIDLLYFPLYLLTLTVMHVFRVLRWKPMLKPMQEVSFWTLNKICAVGFMSVFILPVRIGELVRPYLLSEEENIKMSQALGTIVLERTIDGLSIGLFLIVALFFLPTGIMETYQEIRTGTYIALVLFVSAVFFLAFLFFMKEKFVDLIFRMISFISEGFAQRISGFLHNFISGLSVFPDIRNFSLFLVFSSVYWISNGFGLYIFSRGFGLSFSLLAAFVMEATIVIGMLIPNSPANVGSFWYFLLLPLGLYGVKQGDPSALIYGLCVWLTQLLQLSAFGGYFLLRGKVRFKRLRSFF